MKLRNYFLVFLFINISLFGLEFNVLLESVKKNNNKLNILKNNIGIQNIEKRLSTIFENPTLTLGRNNININDLNSFDKEPMQSYYLSISQLISTNSKLTYKENISIEDLKIANLLLKDEELKLTSLTFSYFYKGIILQKKLSIIKEYINNCNELYKFASNLYENNQNSKIKLINIDTLISTLNIKKQDLIFELKYIYLNLKLLSHNNITNLNGSVSINKVKKYDPRILENHPKVLLNRNKILRQKELIKFQKSKKIPDLKVNLAYFKRDNKYDDFLNLNFAIKLPVYNRENLEIVKNRSKLVSLEKQLDEELISLKISLDLLNANMNRYYKNYKIIKNKIIEDKKIIKKYTKQYYGQGNDNILKLFEADNDIFNSRLYLLDQLELYYKSLAQSIYIVGDIK